MLKDDINVDAYSYRGFILYTEIEEEEDNIKKFHTVIDESKTVRKSFPFSPYGYPSRDIFEKWIDMGMPSRAEMGGCSIHDHRSYYIRWLNDQVDRLLLEGMTDAL